MLCWRGTCSTASDDSDPGKGGLLQEREPEEVDKCVKFLQGVTGKGDLLLLKPTLLALCFEGSVSILPSVDENEAEVGLWPFLGIGSASSTVFIYFYCNILLI